MDTRIILFTRYPVPGLVKTRLVSALGAEGAAELHRRMTERIVSRLQSPALESTVIEIRYTGGTPDEMKRWLGDRCQYRRQGDGDLGVRLREAFADAFTDNAGKVIAIGSDAPELSAELLIDALDRLNTTDVVLGPTFDGGYYLIGMRRFLPELFDEVLWGTDEVFDATIARIEKLSARYELLVKLHDVDRPEDLAFVRELIEA